MGNNYILAKSSSGMINIYPKGASLLDAKKMQPQGYMYKTKDGTWKIYTENKEVNKYFDKYIKEQMDGANEFMFKSGLQLLATPKGFAYPKYLVSGQKFNTDKNVDYDPYVKYKDIITKTGYRDSDKRKEQWDYVKFNTTKSGGGGGDVTPEEDSRKRIGVKPADKEEETIYGLPPELRDLYIKMANGQKVDQEVKVKKTRNAGANIVNSLLGGLAEGFGEKLTQNINAKSDLRDFETKILPAAEKAYGVKFAKRDPKTGQLEYGSQPLNAIDYRTDMLRKAEALELQMEAMERQGTLTNQLKFKLAQQINSLKTAANGGGGYGIDPQAFAQSLIMREISQ